jgi:hypothetical protein
VERLHTAAAAAGAAPDEVPRLEELCAAATLFTTTLAPYVTRRRRDADALINQFRSAQPRLSRADTAQWPLAVRDAYTKLAEGHVSLDLVNTDEPRGSVG